MESTSWEKCEAAAAKVFSSDRDAQIFLTWLQCQFGYKSGSRREISATNLTEENRDVLKDVAARISRHRQGKRFKKLRYSDLSRPEQSRAQKFLDQFLNGAVHKGISHNDSRLRRAFAEAIGSRIEDIRKSPVSYASTSSGNISAEARSKRDVALVKNALDWIFPTATGDAAIIKWLQSFRRREIPSYGRTTGDARIYLAGAIESLSIATKFLESESPEVTEVRQAVKTIRLISQARWRLKKRKDDVL